MRSACSPLHGVVQPVLVVPAVAVTIGIDMDSDGSLGVNVQALEVRLHAVLIIVLLNPDGVICEDAVRNSSQDCNRALPSRTKLRGAKAQR